MFGKRLMSAVLLLSLAGVALAAGGSFLLVLSIIVALAGTYEFMKVDDLQKTIPGCICYISVVGFYLLLFFQISAAVQFWLVVSVIVLLGAYVFQYPRYHIKSITLCYFSTVYVAVLVSFLYQTRCLEYGNWFVWLILIVASGSDTFAYLTGILIGKHHFSELSPKKTIEGCVGGVAGAAVLAFVYSLFLPEQVEAMFRVNPQVLFTVMGMVGSGVSQIGDLAASAVKRNYNIKDYSNLIPGHGGVLDRFDSILFVAPFIYYMLVCFVMF